MATASILQFASSYHSPAMLNLPHQRQPVILNTSDSSENLTILVERQGAQGDRLINLTEKDKIDLDDAESNNNDFFPLLQRSFHSQRHFKTR